MATALTLARQSVAVGPNHLTLSEAEPFDFAGLVARAERMAQKDFVPRPEPAPDVVEEIDYEAHGQLHFRRDLALFAEGPGIYPVTFFHLGQFFPRPVQMYAVTKGEARRIVYSPTYFEIPADSVAQRMPDEAGFAGFRLHEARHRDDWKTQDWTAFLGASYFRAIGELGQYGLSARGIAVDTAAGVEEEFPDFVEFYIEPALTEGAPVHVYALLDGPSVTGAYHFAIRRTSGVVMDVDKRLFMRQPVARLGIAPLTSMFWYGEYNRPYMVDWRPEVHDSDGLALWTGSGERIWRPLNNPPSARTSSFAARSPKGFGLMQRDRNFEHYLDGVHYERRPSLWVEPLDAWGPGSVMLVELPTNDEIHDNIVAFWVPSDPAKSGASYRFRYRLHWLADHPYPASNLGRTVATRIGRGGEPGKPRPEGVRKFVIEFSGGPLDQRRPADEPSAVITATRGTVSNTAVERVPGTRRWRAQFDLEVEGMEPVELRLYLASGDHDQALTETWLYQHLPALAA